MLPTDDETIAFDLYRQGQSGWIKVNAAPISDRTNFQDTEATLGVDNTWRLVYAGENPENQSIDEYTMSGEQSGSWLPYIKIEMEPTDTDPRLNASVTYAVNDGGIADLDGDGQYEIIVRRNASSIIAGNSHVIFDAYKLDGTFMWRVCMGPNVASGNGTSFIAMDFDGDGKDEVYVRSAEGTIFESRYPSALKKPDGSDYPEPVAVSGGYMIGDTNGDGKIDYDNMNDHNGYAPEFVSIIDGVTGAEIGRAPYIPIGENVVSWNVGSNRYPGENDFYMANSLRMAGGKLKPGNKFNPIAQRGCYTRIVLEAWEFNGPAQPMTKLWNFDTDANNGFYSKYRGQANHQLTVADVDADGLDEITFGAAAIDHDGKGLYSTELGHGDLLYTGKFVPGRAGLQTFQCHESGLTAISLRDARTGKLLMSTTVTNPAEPDEGRCLIADIDHRSPGYEMWGLSQTMYTPNGQPTGSSMSAWGYPLWWSGSLNRQIMNGTSINQLGNGPIETDHQGNGRTFTIYRYPISTINGTKDNSVYTGDFLGDWREEMILAGNASQGQSIFIFSTWYPTVYKFPYLMSDDVYYRSAVHQNVGYNVQNNLGYYLGSDLLNN